jgi:hypothetical protein
MSPQLLRCLPRERGGSTIRPLSLACLENPSGGEEGQSDQVSLQKLGGVS